MRYIFLILIFCCFGCNNERVLQLPEIENSEITEVLDVSPAYIFYDETQADSTLLNRKNLISTTNWLVNVDKRLTLKQAIPHIKFLQDKKRNAEVHKNENAKNYFTCNAASIKNLGFIEFTDVFFRKENPDFIKYSIEKPGDYVLLKYHSNGTISISVLHKNTRILVLEKEQVESLKDLRKNLTGLESTQILLFFDSDMTFQDYISAKSQLSNLEIDGMTIDHNEYLF